MNVAGLVPRYAQAVSEPELLASLSSGLAGCVEEPVLRVRYSQGEGRVTLGGRWTGCAPTSDALAPLTPASRALARYRDELVRFDPLLASFSLQLQLGDCALTLAGQIPPDGSTFSPCIERAEPCAPTLQGVDALALTGCWGQAQSEEPAAQ